MKRTLTLLFMAAITYTLSAQIDMHSHAVTAVITMQDKANPAKIYILEVYADNAAYQSHIQTPHFKKYKEGTAKMVRSLRLIDVDPLVTLKVK